MARIVHEARPTLMPHRVNDLLGSEWPIGKLYIYLYWQTSRHRQVVIVVLARSGQSKLSGHSQGHT